MEKRPEIIACEVASCEDAVPMAQREQPDIILLNLDIECDSGLSLLAQVTGVARGARIIAFTATRDAEVHRQAIFLGVKGFLFPEEGIETLLQVIERVHVGGVWFPSRLMENVLTSMAEANAKTDAETERIAALTAREREIIDLIGQKLTIKQMAPRLGISYNSLRNALTRLYRKLGVANRPELVVYLYRHHFIKPPH